MNQRPEIYPNRRSIRLQGYDYTQAGAYFVTICTQNRVCLFGTIVEGEIQLNAAGELVGRAWFDLPNHYENIDLDAFVIMPNHVHGIIVITGMDHVGAGFKPAPTVSHGLPEFIRAFKTFSSRRINDLHQTTGTKIWQRNYHEHIVRNDDELNRIRQYITDNPAQWALDRENPIHLL